MTNKRVVWKKIIKRNTFEKVYANPLKYLPKKKGEYRYEYLRLLKYRLLKYKPNESENTK